MSDIGINIKIKIDRGILRNIIQKQVNNAYATGRPLSSDTIKGMIIENCTNDITANLIGKINTGHSIITVEVL